MCRLNAHDQHGDIFFKVRYQDINPLMEPVFFSFLSHSLQLLLIPHKDVVVVVVYCTFTPNCAPKQHDVVYMAYFF